MVRRSPQVARQAANNSPASVPGATGLEALLVDPTVSQQSCETPAFVDRKQHSAQSFVNQGNYFEMQCACPCSCGFEAGDITCVGSACLTANHKKSWGASVPRSRHVHCSRFIVHGRSQNCESWTVNREPLVMSSIVGETFRFPQWKTEAFHYFITSLVCRWCYSPKMKAGG